MYIKKKDFNNLEYDWVNNEKYFYVLKWMKYLFDLLNNGGGLFYVFLLVFVWDESKFDIYSFFVICNKYIRNLWIIWNFFLEIIYIGYLICLILDIWDVVIWVLFMFVVGNIDLFLEFIFVDIGIFGVILIVFW